MNPYQTTSANPSAPPKNKRLRMFAGFVLGATPVAILGGYNYYSFECYVASLPPGVSTCGEPAAMAVLTVVFLAPLSGLICGCLARM